MRYARPLVRGEAQVPYVPGIPRYADLAKNMVEKKLDSYNI
jgi:hypothetical protein